MLTRMYFSLALVVLAAYASESPKPFGLQSEKASFFVEIITYSKVNQPCGGGMLGSKQCEPGLTCAPSTKGLLGATSVCVASPMVDPFPVKPSPAALPVNPSPAALLVVDPFHPAVGAACWTDNDCSGVPSTDVSGMHTVSDKVSEDVNGVKQTVSGDVNGVKTPNGLHTPVDTNGVKPLFEDAVGDKISAFVRRARDTTAAAVAGSDTVPVTLGNNLYCRTPSATAQGKCAAYAAVTEPCGNGAAGPLKCASPLVCVPPHHPRHTHDVSGATIPVVLVAPADVNGVKPVSASADVNGVKGPSQVWTCALTRPDHTHDDNDDHPQRLFAPGSLAFIALVAAGSLVAMLLLVCLCRCCCCAQEPERAVGVAPRSTGQAKSLPVYPINYRVVPQQTVQVKTVPQVYLARPQVVRNNMPYRAQGNTFSPVPSPVRGAYRVL